MLENIVNFHKELDFEFITNMLRSTIWFDLDYIV